MVRLSLDLYLPTREGNIYVPDQYRNRCSKPRLHGKFDLTEADVKGKGRVLLLSGRLTLRLPDRTGDMADGKISEFQKLGVEVYSCPPTPTSVHSVWADASKRSKKIGTR